VEIIEIEKTYHSFKKKEFEDYFSERGKCKSPGCYIGDGWEVSLGEEKKRSVGPMEFVAVTIYLKLSTDIEKAFITHLRGAFLKGGG